MYNLEIQVDPSSVRSFYKNEISISPDKFYYVRFVQPMLNTIGFDESSDSLHFDDDKGNEVFIFKRDILKRKEY